MILAALCLASNIYFEARGEPIDGQILVAEVTMNRGSDICATVFAKDQFSWTNDKFLCIDNPEAFYQAYALASEMIDSGCILCSEATFYHSNSVEPYWAEHMVLLGSYGNHIFYKENT
jgi:spore germination cell wall hydrolase CwlJ-like protein